MNKSKLRKNFIWNTLGTGLNAFNSLFFLIIVVRINGVNDAGIFSFAFSTACLFLVIGIYSGRAYQVTENDKRITDTDYFYTKIFTCLVMVLVGIGFCLINQYDMNKFLIIMFLTTYRTLEAFSEFSYAVIQKKDDLYKVGISLLLKSVFSLLLFIIIDYLFKNLLLSTSLIVIVNLLVILIYDIPNLKKANFKIKKFNKDNCVLLLKRGFATFGFSFLTMYVINASKYAIDGTLADNYQTIYGIILMPATILSLLAQFIIQPFVLRLKNAFSKNFKQFRLLVIKLLGFIVLIGLITLLLAYFLGVPVLNILYSIKLNKYLIDLMIIMVGAVFYAITMIFSTALITMRKTFNQLVVYSITSIFALFISEYLVVHNKLQGASYAYLLSMLLLLVLYIIIYLVSVRKEVSHEKTS